jgi:ribonuclease HII
MPDFGIESGLWEKGYQRIAGVDEAGRGPLAGPVVIAAVVLPRGWESPVALDDSKRMTPQARDEAYTALRRAAVAWRMAVIPPADIDRLNILQATLAGMRRAVARFSPPPDFVLIDGNRAPELPVPCEPVVKGDRRSLSIAAASIMAKVVRDRIMCVYGRWYPEWGFEQHKGYGTAKHRAALRHYGPSPIHRASFKVREPG